MVVPDPADCFQEVPQVVLLGESRELRDVVEAHVDDLLNARTSRICLIKHLRGTSEQIGLGKSKLSKQTRNSVVMTLEAPILQDVRDRHSVCDEMPTDQDRPMAGEGVFLGAHQRYPVIPHPLQHTFKPASKEGRLCQAVVPDLPVHVAASVFGTRPELMAEEDVSDPSVLQLRAEGLAIELRIHPAVWLRPDVRHRRDAVFPEEVHYLRRRVRRMPNCVKHVVHESRIRTVGHDDGGRQLVGIAVEYLTQAYAYKRIRHHRFSVTGRQATSVQPMGL
jgi:hypothetical protein